MKLKSHSGAKKRVRINAKGLMRRNKVSHRHLLVNKSKRQKKLARKGIAIDKTDLDRLHGLLPYA